MTHSSCIAVVDDDEVLRSSLVDLLRSTGHCAQSFISAETFLAAPNLALFDCVIADVHMIGMSGFGLVRKLRDQGSATPVILITAQTNGHLDRKAVSAGARCLLRKPLEIEILLEQIEKSQ